MTIRNFNAHMPECGHLFVDRNSELRTAVDWIVSGSGNLLISGERGIGKTSLALKAVADASEAMEGTLVIKQTVFRFQDGDFDGFLAELGRQITVTIWQKLTGKSFSDLLSGSMDYEEKKIERRDVSTLRRIYGVLSASQLAAKVTRVNKIGGSLILEAGKEEALEKGIERSQLTGFEFLALVDELKDVTLAALATGHFAPLRCAKRRKRLRRYRASRELAGTSVPKR